jgi:predicted nucleic acid-binding Zn ribbon protein
VLESYSREAAPATLLAGVQACWAEVAGEAVAAEAEPVEERSGTVTFRCSSGVWANELDLLSGDLLERLNRTLADRGGPPAGALRFRVL